MKKCACGRDGRYRLVYVVSKSGRQVTSDPKCGRCADKAAFALIWKVTHFIKAERVYPEAA